MGLKPGRQLGSNFRIGWHYNESVADALEGGIAITGPNSGLCVVMEAYIGSKGDTEEPDVTDDDGSSGAAEDG